MDDIFNKLIPMSHKWKQLVEVIGLDINDEIFTNNEGDEVCLRAVLEVWIKKSLTWKTVIDSLRKIGEDELAESLPHDCKTHYFLH